MSHCIDCSAEDFQCSNGQCIPSCKHCDGILDCYDQSDEFQCSKSSVKVMKVLQTQLMRFVLLVIILCFCRFVLSVMAAVLFCH